MPAIPHVIRRGAVYYWRRRLPGALAESRGSATLLLGLRTKDPQRARLLGSQVSALADLFFADVMTQRLSQTQIQTVFRIVFSRHLDKLEAVAARERIEPDFDAEESRRSDVVAGWVYRLLEMRGSSARLDQRAIAQMQDGGLADDVIADVASMLEGMRRNDLAAERPERLKALVQEAGGDESPMNLALAQETYFRAMAEANLQVARRYDGFRAEGRALIEDAIRKHAMEPSTSSSSAPIFVQDRDLREMRRADGAIAGAATSRAEQPQNPAAIFPASDPDLGRDVENRGDDQPQKAMGRSTATKQPALTPDKHPIAVLGAQLVKKNEAIWDLKTQRQAMQIYGLLAKLLCEAAVYELADLRQSHFAALDDLLGSVAKSYGKASRMPHARRRSFGPLERPSRL